MNENDITVTFTEAEHEFLLDLLTYAQEYNLTKGEKRFSLFNVNIWNEENLPACCHVVPTLYSGVFDTGVINRHMFILSTQGSLASPGFMNPEGVMIYHSAANHYFKAPFDKNHKG